MNDAARTQERDLKEKISQLEEMYRDTISAWANTIDSRTKYTKHHSDNVRRYAEAIGKRVYLTSKEMKILTMAAILHDIGKDMIESAILNKPGELTEEEYEKIKQHASRSAEIMNSVEHMEEAVDVIRSHHERFDGKGYPRGLRGEEIPYLARILAVADAFDAMTSERPYRPKMSVHEAMLELQANSGTQFDPEPVDALVHILRANPNIVR
jgi:putative nucleotidyltransferase with HDIG domain